MVSVSIRFVVHVFQKLAAATPQINIPTTSADLLPHVVVDIVNAIDHKTADPPGNMEAKVLPRMVPYEKPMY